MGDIHFGERILLVKSFLRHEEDKMSNDFENSQEYRKALEIAKKQQELHKNVTKAISP